MNTMNVPVSKLAILFANTLIPVALLIFCSGYFPYKPILPGIATRGESRRPHAVFDRVILMVVDALRSDFVYSNNSGFLYTQDLIRSGSALPFTAHASSPTVTMPRVKAITTGSVPSFSDLILNIADSETMSTLAHQDSILAQFKAGLKGRLVMYGDNTWLKLFPEMFDRTDGTTSFFVSDFVEVDNNVTRHISQELKEDDWSALVLHYLGLDHIGHKAGPRSLYMIPKQREMDAVVKEIYAAMEYQEHLQSTLLVLCGDHGMNEAGNHGGSSLGETSPALTFISPKLKGKMVSRDCPIEASDEYQYYRTIEQSDITPTLAGLLGVPIPLNNLGVFIPELLNMWEFKSDRLGILLENSRQILEIIKMTFPEYSFHPKVSSMKCENNIESDIEQLECTWLGILDYLKNIDMVKNSQPELESALLDFLHQAQRVMSSTASNYSLSKLYLGTFTAAIAVLVSITAAYNRMWACGYPAAFLVAAVVAHGSIMFASSYVEEEQQFWYWLTTAWTIYLHVKSTQGKHASIKTASLIAGPLILAALHRIVRRWNQTGQKFAGEPDIAQSYLSNHPKMLFASIFLTYIDACRNLIQASPFYESSRVTTLWSSVSVILSCLAFVFKLSFTAADSPELLGIPMLEIIEGIQGSLSLILQAKIVFIGVIVLVVTSIYINGRNKAVITERVPYNRLFHETLTLFLITQSRSVNIPLFLLFRAQASILISMRLNFIEVTITSIVSQYMVFFAFGGSNAISSIDLSSAYNGVSSYNVLLVGFLTFVNNWAGPIWWVSATRLISTYWTWKDQANYVIFSTFHVTFNLLSVMTACTILRTHLFVWTVFSPKLLYSMAWALAQHIIVNVVAVYSVSPFV